MSPSIQNSEALRAVMPAMTSSSWTSWRGARAGGAGWGRARVRDSWADADASGARGASKWRAACMSV
jgi:hypothetical protein